jgi:hypothetical protein
MRLVAALITGMSLGQKDIKTRCVPSAIALVDELKFAEGDKVAVLFDGRNKEILLFELIKEAGEMRPSGKTRVLNQEQAKTFFAENNYQELIALDYDLANMELVLPREVLAKIHWAKKLALEKLINCKYKDFDNDLTDLVYIRPAVFS